MPVVFKKHVKNYEGVSNIVIGQPKESLRTYDTRGSNILSTAQKSNPIESKSKKQFQKCVGALKAVWKIKGFEEVGVSTAFAISPSIIVTCAHSIYNPIKHQICSYAEFIPPAKNAQKAKEKIRTKEVKFLRFEKIKEYERYSYKPLRTDYAVLILEKPLELDTYLTLAMNQPIKEKQTQLWGYPKESQGKLSAVIKSKQQRKDLNGFYLSSKGDSQGKYIMVHNMSTKGGHSGSPILQVNNNMKQVVGLHTHKGNVQGANQGLMMSVIRSKILSFAEELLIDHRLEKEVIKLWQIHRHTQTEINVNLPSDDKDISTQEEDEPNKGNANKEEQNPFWNQLVAGAS